MALAMSLRRPITYFMCSSSTVFPIPYDERKNRIEARSSPKHGPDKATYKILSKCGLGFKLQGSSYFCGETCEPICIRSNTQG